LCHEQSERIPLVQASISVVCIPAGNSREKGAKRQKLYVLYIRNQFFLGFDEYESVVYRASCFMVCADAHKQQMQLDRVVPGFKSGAFRTDENEQVRNTEGEKRIETARAD
jgi:hypothetical protein